MSARCWRSAADELAAQIALDALDTAACEAIRASRGSCTLACSGGADSVALVLLVWAHFREIRDRLRIAHFNHRVRGSDADADAQFVKALADELGVPFSGGTADQDLTNAQHVSEAELREKRWAFLESAGVAGSKDPRECLILTGHHLGDVAELLLMRLGRGSGVSGMAGLRPVQPIAGSPTRVRPLLGLKPEMLRQSLATAGVSWREDASNSSERWTRNRLRHQVLDAWISACPGDALAGAGRVRRLMQETEDALRAAVPVFGIKSLPDKCLSFSMQVPVPRAVVRQAVHDWLIASRVEGSLKAGAMDILLEAIEQKSPVSVSAGNRHLVWDGHALQLQTSDRAVATDWGLCGVGAGAMLAFPDGSSLTVAWVELDDAARSHILGGRVDAAREVWIDAEGLDAPEDGLIVRQWRAGDRYHPLGAPGSRKLQDCFVDKKVPVNERMRLPVVLNRDQSILWVPGLEPAEQARVRPSSRRALRLTYQPF